MLHDPRRTSKLTRYSLEYHCDVAHANGTTCPGRTTNGGVKTLCSYQLSAQSTPLLRCGDYEVRAFSQPGRHAPLTSASGGDCPTGDWVAVASKQGGAFRIVVADLAGKGDGARRFHEHLRRMLKTCPEMDAAKWLTQTHRTWPDDRFATVAVLDIDVAQHKAIGVTAGHPPLIVKTASAGARIWETHSLPPVGIRIDELWPTEPPDVSITEAWRFPVDASCVLVSDGVLDAGIATSEPWGLKRLLQTVDRADAGPELADHIGQYVREHMNGERPLDDLSVVTVFRRKRNVQPTVSQ